ncbi:MAG: AAA family ATPase [Parcubacteria group bacterium]|nr:AAA family ATPase [Parcubacteria group bacterium]
MNPTPPLDKLGAGVKALLLTGGFSLQGVGSADNILKALHPRPKGRGITGGKISPIRPIGPIGPMHLKRLELSGFKSFPKKTTLDLPRGITVIAGPNGSGKSNIVDAIRWALAEQSFKNLRSRKGEDLIFFGSSSRGSLARASVAMVFERAGNSNVDMEEMELMREVDRSGENGYWLNNRRVRLADLESFLAKSGIGGSSFRVLSQGMSDRFLNLSPEEFRAFVEEAAGVKDFQDKKHSAVLKIKNTEDNLGRVEGILAELEPQLKLLKRERERLSKKEEYGQELKSLSRQYFGSKYHAMLAAERKLEEKRRDLKTQLKPLGEAVAGLRRELFSFDKKTAEQAELAKLAAEIRNLEAEDNRLMKETIAEEGKIDLEKEREKQRLPVSVEYLKEKISGWVGKLNVDFKRLDANQLRQLLAELYAGLKALLETIEKGVAAPDHVQKLALLQDGLHKLLTRHNMVKQQSEELRLARAGMEKFILEERLVTLAKEKSYREKEAELVVLEGASRQLELEEEKLKLHQQKFHQDLAAVGGITLADVLDNQADQAGRPVLALAAANKSADLAALEERIWKLKRRMDEIGLIDEKVAKDYEAVNERFEFLSREAGDLKASLGSLQHLIKDLDKQINGCYRTTLADMSRAFGDYFRLIFGGGKASLSESGIRNQELGDEDGEGESGGVEIKLELPGKKVKSLNTLSGGERTLTSIALLFALVSIRQPPLLVLDEIDAALDETNTQKFIRLLKDLSRQTQFVVITHNRETMRGADALYGVSMKDGISHLLSLRLQSV